MGEGTYLEHRSRVLMVVIVSGDSGDGRGDLPQTLPLLGPGGGDGGGRGDLPGG